MESSLISPYGIHAGNVWCAVEFQKRWLTMTWNKYDTPASYIVFILFVIGVVVAIIWHPSEISFQISMMSLGLGFIISAIMCIIHTWD